MNPSSWSFTDWLLIVTLIGGAIGTVLKGQHMLITSLFRDKWDAQERRVGEVEIKVDEVESISHENSQNIAVLDAKMVNVEKACDRRHSPRSFPGGAL